MKKNKIFKGLLISSSIILPATLAISAKGCFDFRIDPDSSRIPNIPGKPISPSDPGKENKIENKNGYIAYRSSNNETFLKKNNDYYFPDLEKKDEIFDASCFINEDFKLKEFNPKRWRTIEFISKGEWDKDKYTEDDFTLEPEDAYKIYNMARQFYFKRFDSSGSGLDTRETFHKFIRDFRDHLESNFKGYGEENTINNSGEPEFVDPTTYYTLSMQNTFKDNLAPKLTNHKLIFDQYLKIIGDSGWKNEWSPEYKWFCLPYSFGQNSYIKNKFGNNAHFDMYNDTRFHSEIDMGITKMKTFENWNLLSFEDLRVVKKIKQDDIQTKFYKTFYKFLSTLINIEQDNQKKKWSEFDKTKLEDVRVALNGLATQTVELLSWKSMLLSEIESRDDDLKGKETITNIFAAGVAKGQNPTAIFPDSFSDIQNSWAFAYKILYDVIIPFYAMCDEWTIPNDLIIFDKEISSDKSEAYYIYQLALFYINKVMKEHYGSEFEELKVHKDFIKDIENKKDYLKTVFLKFIENWSPVLNMGVNSEEI